MKTDPKTPGSWPLFLTAHAVLTEAIEKRLAAAALPPLNWYDVLWALERAPGQRLRMHELADYVVLSRPNLTRLVDRLETAGLLTRAPDPDDRRGAFAVLSAAGAAERARMWPVYAEAIDSLYDRHASADEQAVLRRVFKRMLEHARSGAA
ncbi:MarR family winged helix-turn-helix transcriptional regulator [Massilia sp. TS11]|uniref:MarR family winged helix-turn-helix transcriptional regulator n=1 Tax=Massilia sp. TS11 TaxID=2908003 RepID=UPI001EDAE095|nr:MarR family transcriptional regulator [Massilia sp. TS11]MCG2583718.1 MarR family transcriptional regulator [Massilia sp. TS11]